MVQLNLPLGQHDDCRVLSIGPVYFRLFKSLQLCVHIREISYAHYYSDK